MKSQTRSALYLFLVILMTVTGQVLPAAAQDAPATPKPAAPIVMNVTPAEGTAWAGDPVAWTFDQPVDVSNSKIAPPLDGAWAAEGKIVTFTPAAPPEADQRYSLSFEARAAGSGDDAPVTVAQLALVGRSPLRVTSTQPADGASDVAVDGTVVVSFNRPVVPLVGASEQASLPQPLSFDPPLEGTGEWLGTSIYSFQPEPGMAGATSYTASVEPLTAVGGEAMTATVTFAFTTTEPLVTGASPTGNKAGPDTNVQVYFSQAMDKPSTEAAFSLVANKTDAAVEGVFRWSDAQTTLFFTPTAPLDFGGLYTINVAKSAQPASKVGGLRQPFSTQFSVVPLPYVQRSTPADGEEGVLPDQMVSIYFGSPMSRTLVIPAVSISPPITASLVYSYYNDWENSLVIDWPRQPNSTYTVTVGASAGDFYGNTLGEDFNLSYTTGDFSPFVRVDLDQFTQFTPITTTYVSLFYRNMDELNQSLYRLSVDDFVDQFNGQNSWSVWDTYEVPNAADALVWSRTYTTTDTLNETYQSIVPLDDGDGNPLKPGLYLLETTIPPTPSSTTSGTIDRTLNVIAITNNGLIVKKSTDGSSLAWLTGISDAKPISGADVTFLVAGSTLGSATTDDQGAAVQELAFPPDVQWLALVAVVGEPGDEDFSIASSAWNQGIAGWDFGLNSGYNLDEYQTVFYTDRPIYRPGQTVFWKGIVRRLSDGQYSLPDPSTPMTITVRDDRGNTVVQQLADFNDMGTLNGQFELAPDAVSGNYYLEALLPLTPDNTLYAGTGFQVASYRKPEFEVNLAPSQPAYSQGDEIEVGVQANYYSGGPLASAPLTWRVIAEPFTFTWDDAPKGRWFSFTPFDPNADTYDPYAPVDYYGQVKEGSGATDASGAYTLTMDADLGEALQSQQWSVDVTVESPTHQFVNSVTSFPVHLGEYYVGISPQTSVAQAGQQAAIDIVAVDPDGKTVGGVDVTVDLYQYRWNNVRQLSADGRFTWQSTVERILVSSSTVRTGQDGMATVTWTPPVGGQYQVVASSTDSAGNKLASTTFVYATDPDPNAEVSWQQGNNDRIELVSDQEEYALGDTARILVPNPFLGPVTALLTIEGSGVNQYETRQIEGGSPTIEVPITEEMIPNTFVSVALIKGIDETNPTPAMRIGYLQLNVDTAARELDIEAVADLGEGNETALPGQVVTWTVTVRNDAGKPVADSEVSVAVVDKALLALAADNVTSLIDAFYHTRPLGVTTGATLNINRDRVSQQLSEGAKGGGGGGGGSMYDVREDFPDTAFWTADFMTDKNGQFVFSMTMPDNLTTWQLFARGVTANTDVGDGTTDLIVTKELQLRPALPRFFTGGDKARIGAVVINTSDVAAKDGSFTVEVEGATIDGPAEFPLDLEPGASATFSFPIAVPDSVDAITVTMVAEAGSLNDAVRMVLPVSRYRTPEVVATSGVVDDQVTEAILPPDEAKEGDLVVRVEPSLAAGMTEGLTWLENYPWECTEQTVSRFLPNLFTVRAINASGISNPELEANLNYQMGAAVQQLVSRQNADGGWGYWPGETSNTFVTAWALWGLYNAQQMGYPVPQDTIDRAADYLERSYVAPADVTENWKLNQLAFVHFVLSEMGKGDPGRMSTLYDVRERLQIYGKALLAMAMYNVDATDARAQTLLNDVAGAASTSATGAWWSEDSIQWQTLNTDLRSTAIALEAFTRIQPDNPLLPNVVRWLMSVRSQATWSNTQESAWAILALTDWMSATDELDANYDWKVELNASEMGSGHADQETLRTPVELREDITNLLRDEPNLLTLSRSDDPGRMYYSAWLNYTLDALAVQPMDRGIVVDRRFEVNGEPVSSARVGDIISVTVTIVAPTDLYQLHVDVPIPAGVEIIDPNLVTSPTYGPDGLPLPNSATNSWLPTYRDFRDDRAALFDTQTPAGTYQYTFPVRATLPGEYRVLPATAEMMYFTEVWGRSSGEVFTVTE